jgi:L-2,4-diaminobutyric acid acetyltransferase
VPVASQQTSEAPSRVEIRFRQPRPSDGEDLWGIAGSAGLDVNSAYAYVLWGEYFSSTSLVATVAGEPVGFVTGFCPPGDPDTLFVWQIAVAEPARGQGLSSKMLDELVARTPVRWLEATVTPSNAASTAMFRSFAARHGASVSNEVAFGRDVLPDDHEEEIRFRIGPIASRTNDD